MAGRIGLDFRGSPADELTAAGWRSRVARPAAVFVLLLLVSGCATPRARESPRVPAVRADDAPAEARQELEQVTQRLDAAVSRSDDLENALARLGARIEALERQVEHLAALFAHARASRSPSAAGGGVLPAPPGASAPGPGAGLPSGVALAPGGAPPTAEELYQAGMAKFQAGELDAAVLTFYDLVTSYPRHPLRESGQFMVGDIFFAQKDVQGALREFEELLAQVPNGTKTAETLLKIGLCQRGLGDEASARRIWQRLVKEHPQSVPARQARVLLGGPRQRERERDQR